MTKAEQIEFHDLKDAAKKLIVTLDAINANKSFQGLFTFAFTHGYLYDGPTFDSELEALRAVIR